MLYTLEQIVKKIKPIADAYGVDKVSLFGSYSKGTATDNSDLDLIIKKGKIRSLFQLSGFRLALEDALCIPVDLITTEANDKQFLSMIAPDEVTIYESAV